MSEKWSGVSPKWWRENYGVTTRLAKALWRSGVATLQLAAEIDSEKWMESRNFGNATLNELRDLLARHGLRLRDEPRRPTIGTAWTHDIPVEIDALLARLRACDGKQADAVVVVWEQSQMLADEVDRLRAMYASAADRIAAQSELLSRRAEKP